MGDRKHRWSAFLLGQKMNQNKQNRLFCVVLVLAFFADAANEVVIVERCGFNSYLKLCLFECLCGSSSRLLSSF